MNNDGTYPPSNEQNVVIQKSYSSKTSSLVQNSDADSGNTQISNQETISIIVVDIDTENQEPPSYTNLEESTNTQSALYIENINNEYSNSNYPSYILPQTANTQPNSNNMGYNSGSSYTNKGSYYSTQSDNPSSTYNVPDNELNGNLPNGKTSQYNSQSYLDPSNQDPSIGDSYLNSGPSNSESSIPNTENNYDPYMPNSYGSIPINSSDNPTDTTQGYGNTGMGSNQYNYNNNLNLG